MRVVCMAYLGTARETVAEGCSWTTDDDAPEAYDFIWNSHSDDDVDGDDDGVVALVRASACEFGVGLQRGASSYASVGRAPPASPRAPRALRYNVCLCESVWLALWLFGVVDTKHSDLSCIIEVARWQSFICCSAVVNQWKQLEWFCVEL